MVLFGTGPSAAAPNAASFAPPTRTGTTRTPVAGPPRSPAGRSPRVVQPAHAGLIREVAPLDTDHGQQHRARGPKEGGPVPGAPAEFLSWLRTLAGPDGRLPRWTDWWPADDVAATLPDPQVRREIVADPPRLPPAHYEQAVPVPASWAAVPGAYLQFTCGYDDAARAAGWPVEQITGEHLHQAIDPAIAAIAIQRLVALARGA
jgi:hypothetical protein